jgi:hypothetical protein
MSMHACMALYNKGHRQHGMSMGGPTRTNVSRKEPSIGNKKERKVGEGVVLFWFWASPDYIASSPKV